MEPAFQALHLQEATAMKVFEEFISIFRVLREDGSQSRLDAWSQWLIRLGFDCSQLRDNNRNTICISVPDRGFASAFLMLGAVIGSAIRDVSENVDHKIRLKNLKFGDLISIPDTNGHLRSATIHEINEQTISYFRHGEGCKTTRNLDTCRDIWPLINGEKIFRTSSHKLQTDFANIGTKLNSILKILQLRSSNDVAVVGIEDLLERELFEVPFTLDGQTLGSFVKPFGLIGIAERCQSIIIPSSSTSIPETLSDRQKILIFDGARGYLNLYNQLAAMNTIVVLDRRAPGSTDAATLIRQMRSRWVGFGSPFVANSKPVSVEFISWSEQNE